MTETVRVAVPRKGRPLEAVLERLASGLGVSDLAADVISTLRYEKSVTKGVREATASVYDRVAGYSDLADPTRPEYTLVRDCRAGMPRRIVFDSVTIPADDVTIQLIGREEPFRALRTHEFALGFDSADLVLEEVVELRPDPIRRIAAVNERIDPRDTDVRVVTGLGDTVYHTLMASPEVLAGLGATPAELAGALLEDYAGPLCVSPRYERLVEAVLGTRATADVSFCYPGRDQEEEAGIADAGLGVYLTVTGATAREHGLLLGERLFPSETVLMENRSEATSPPVDRAKRLLAGPAADIETALAVR